MDGRGRDSLERARQTSRELRDVELVLPDVVFDGVLVSLIADAR
jgi:hypothetical protein